jgi:hypothetical protein
MGTAGYDNTLFSSKERKENSVKAISDSKLLNHDFSVLAQKNDFICFQVLRPEKDEIERDKYSFSLSDLTAGSDSIARFHTVDLLRFYRDSVGMDQNTTKNYFWKIDGHHNPKGYAAMAKGVYTYLMPEIEKIILRR